MAGVVGRSWGGLCGGKPAGEDGFLCLPVRARSGWVRVARSLCCLPGFAEDPRCWRVDELDRHLRYPLRDVSGGTIDPVEYHRSRPSRRCLRWRWRCIGCPCRGGAAGFGAGSFGGRVGRRASPGALCLVWRASGRAWTRLICRPAGGAMFAVRARER